MLAQRALEEVEHDRVIAKARERDVEAAEALVQVAAHDDELRRPARGRRVALAQRVV